MARQGDLIAGRYRIATRLGRGGMGTVWRARDELLGRSVAVKELHVDDELSYADAELQRERTLREAQTVAQVRHPNIMVLHDIVAHDAQPWIVMELIDGRSLADRITLEGPLAPAEAARIGLDLLSALHAAHASGVQHRDLKPANVLLESATGRVVLSDFGIAQVAGQTTLTETGSFIGSPEYTAPERMSGTRTGPESDLWSLGVLLCAAVDGESPFHRDSVAGVLHAVVIDEIRPPESAGGLLPVIRGLLERDVPQRLTLDDTEKLLRAFMEEEQAGTMAFGRTPAPTPSSHKPLDPRVPATAPGHHAAGSAAAPPGEVMAGAATVGSPPPGGPSRRRGSTPARRGARTRIAVLSGVLVAVLAAGSVGTGVWLLNRDNAGYDIDARPTKPVDKNKEDPKGPEGSRVPAPSASDSLSPSPSASKSKSPSPGATSSGSGSPSGSSSPSPSDSGDDVPAGYRTVTDPLGFKLKVPEGFTRSFEDPRVYYYSPNKQFRLGIHPQPQDPDGPYAVMQQAHKDGPDDYPGYRNGSVRETTYNGHPAGLWAFSWDGSSDDSGARNTYDLSWDEDGKMWDMWISGPAAKQTEVKRYFEVAMESFEVTG